ncbi:response regulator transcription factor [Flavobacterium sp.]|uniref:response regulator transcription factor n=1 Tax=Flavobacterium sp. TaxID=239 RepID=UPI00286B7FDE|nr:response regulator transcription factor [Flavobacterium sp.]
MKTKIIVVEDELLIALHIKKVLEKHDYEVAIDITSVEDAILHIEKTPPDLVLIDINLNKKKEGTELGNYLLEKDSIPYIYITSYSDKSTLEKVNMTRPKGFIVKPFKEEDLLATISVVLNNYYHKKIDTNRVNAPDKDPIPFKVKEIVNYINTHLEKKLDIDELTKLTKWKKDHFTRLFSKYLGVTPYQYVLSRKIEKSKTMLSNTLIPINEIAYELGFDSHSNFYHIFKKLADDTPENYRKRNQV